MLAEQLERSDSGDFEDTKVRLSEEKLSSVNKAKREACKNTLEEKSGKPDRVKSFGIHIEYLKKNGIGCFPR